MNLKRIGGMSLAAATLASASAFGATAAQAGDTETWVTPYESKSGCVAGNKKDAQLLSAFGDTVYKTSCKEDIASFGGYRGYVHFKSRT